MTTNGTPTLIDPSVTGQAAAPVNDGGELIGGRYRLRQLLGEGGMGRVFLAEDQVLARRVAIKTIRTELSSNEELRSRIKRECRLHAAIGAHPNIVTLYDAVEIDGHIYLVMEYCAGETLAHRLTAAGTPGLPLDEAVSIVRQILRALACIHNHDIVHRDIKTSNILLQMQPDGRTLVKLTDFGLARIDIDSGAMTRLTSLGVQGPGTPAYMAPERIDPQNFGAVSPASDLYAVGILLYELVAGQPPFTGTITEIFSGHLVQPPALTALPPGLPERLHAVLQRALAKQPSERYQDTDGFLTALAGLEYEVVRRSEPWTGDAATLLAVAGDAIPADLPEATMLNPSQARAKVISRWTRWPHRWIVAAMAGVLLALVLGGYWAQRWAAPPQQALEQPESPPLATVMPQEPAPAQTDAASDDQSRQKEGSALEVVEQARQQNDPAAAANTSGPVQSPAVATGRISEWQVTENRTRRIQ